MNRKYVGLSVVVGVLFVVSVAALYVAETELVKDSGQNLVDDPSSNENINPRNQAETDRRANPETRPTGEQPMKLKAEVFSGILEKVDIGCFADGECYVVVSGKRVTALRGWSQATVGSIQGVPSFGDLESHIGKKIEVYANALPDGTYTLYGSEGFYIKVIDTTGFSGVELGQGIAVGESNPSMPTPIVTGGCMVGGCSSQLCVDIKDEDGAVTTCEYREEYACYQTASCERQTSGQCGWTESKELNSCLLNKGSLQ